MMEPILRTTISGTVEAVTDTTVTVILEHNHNIFQQEYPLSDFLRTPKVGDVVMTRMMLSVETKSSTDISATPSRVTSLNVPTPATSEKPKTFSKLAVPQAVALRRKKQDLIPDDDDILNQE